MFLALHLNMNQDPFVSAVGPPNFYQLVNDTAPMFRFASDFLKLFVKHFRVAIPVDVSVGLREEEGHEMFKKGLDSLFPRGIEVGGH